MKYSDAENGLNAEIKARVMKELDRIVYTEKLVNMKEFCEMCQIPRTSIYHLKDKEGHRVPLSILHTLVSKFGTDAQWLITGKKVKK